ncbi:uncharacterized protein LOC129595696 [Paramacrobiotus metropolitanus]|uniref:uncharacterized protein LOC129595696 n=1 Tax=Paramacrobiotus metropolitanus TaxID=2943436 RepID=UPI00244570BD|nr:uncharacterized protein LOC129595696 [Paramacrobiotus metropolitanus]
MNVSLNYTLANKTVQTGTTSLTGWFIVTTFVEILTSLLIILLIIAILYRHGKPSESHVQIILMLSVSLLITAVINPALTLPLYFPSLTLSLTNCRFFYVAYIICPSSEQWAAFMLSINRLVAVVFPSHYTKFNKRGVTFATIFLGWLTHLAIGLPIAVASGFDTALAPPLNICVVRPVTPVSIEIFRVTGILGIYLPIAGTNFCYLVILLSQLRFRFSKPTIDRTMDLKIQRRIFIGKMLFASSLWHLVCHVPLIVVTHFYYYLYVKNPHLQLWMRTMYYSGYLGTPVCFKNTPFFS